MVPEHRLLRRGVQRRLHRRRDLLRQGAEGPHARRVREHHRHHEQPLEVRPLHQPREQQGPAGDHPQADVRAGLYLEGAVRRGRGAGARVRAQRVRREHPDHLQLLRRGRHQRRAQRPRRAEGRQPRHGAHAALFRRLSGLFLLRSQHPAGDRRCLYRPRQHAAAPVGLRPAVRVRHRHHGPLHR